MDSTKLTLLHKTLKAARLAIADRVVVKRTNTELLAANTRKKRREQRTGIQYDGQDASVLSLEYIEKRRRVVENKRKDKEAKKLAQKRNKTIDIFFRYQKNPMRLGSVLIYGPKPLISSKNTKNPGSSVRNKKMRGSGLERCISRSSPDRTRFF